MKPAWHLFVTWDTLLVIVVVAVLSCFINPILQPQLYDGKTCYSTQQVRWYFIGKINIRTEKK
jgi:hypothetical protein